MGEGVRTDEASPTIWKRESAAGRTRCGYSERNWPGPNKAKAPEEKSSIAQSKPYIYHLARKGSK